MHIFICRMLRVWYCPLPPHPSSYVRHCQYNKYVTLVQFCRPDACCSCSTGCQSVSRPTVFTTIIANFWRIFKQKIFADFSVQNFERKNYIKWKNLELFDYLFLKQRSGDKFPWLRIAAQWIPPWGPSGSLSWSQTMEVLKFKENA